MELAATSGYLWGEQGVRVQTPDTQLMECCFSLLLVCSVSWTDLVYVIGVSRSLLVPEWINHAAEQGVDVGSFGPGMITF